MGHALVPVSREPDLPTVAEVDVLDAFLAGRKQRTMQAYVRDLADVARFMSSKNPNPAAAVEAIFASGHGAANRIALKYRAHMTERNLAAATIARRLSALRSMVTIARQIGRVPWSLDVDGPKSEPYRDTRGPGLDGWRRLLKKAAELATSPRGKRDLALLLLMHDLGLRRVRRARPRRRRAWRQAGRVDRRQGKDGIATPRWPPGRARTSRLDLRTRPRCRPVSHQARSLVRPRLERLTGDSVCRMVARLGDRAGLQREALPHGLRHQGITRLLDLVVGDVRKVQTFSRHAKIETVMLYGDHRRDDAGALSRLLGIDDDDD